MPAYIPENTNITGSLGSSSSYSPAIYPHPVPNHSPIGMPSNPEYTYFFPLWITMRDTYTGESAVKAKSVIYLPRLEKQTDKEYRAYLGRTPFYNAIHRTHQGLMGSVYRKPPTVKIPEKYANRISLDSVTRSKESLQSLLKEMLSEQLLTGRYGVLIDLPVEPNGRPYAASYKAETILNWRERIINGRTTLDQVLLVENDQQLTEIGTVTVLQFRLLQLVEEGGKMVYKQTVTRIINAAEGVSEIYEVTPVIRGRTLDYIPFVFVGATSNTPDCDYPPLLDIATMNLSHFASYAALEHGRFYAAMPTYYITGEGSLDPNNPANTVNPYVVGPNNLWLLGKDDKPGILEFTGHGLSYLENALDSKQSQMASLGGKLISQSRRQAALSSNAWDLLSAGDEATLLDITQRADEAATSILRMLIEFTGVVLTDEERAETFIELNKQFEGSELTAREIRAVESIYQSRLIPRQVLYNALREVAVIPPTMSEAEFFALLEDEENLAEKPPEPAPRPAPRAGPSKK
jgi:hypothetical protein